MWSRFDEIILLDFEYSQPPGERPAPVCLVAWELNSGRRWRLFMDDLRRRPAAPYPCGPDDLVVAYYAAAEMNCHLALDWPLPSNVLDLYVEFSNLINGLKVPCGRGLLGALTWFGLDAIAATEKEELRQLAMRGGSYSVEEREALLEYCESDVAALASLLPAMLPHLDLNQALLRGRYTKAVACMEHAGVPIDVTTFSQLKTHWEQILLDLIAEVDTAYGVYDGKTFKLSRFAAWLKDRGISNWPRLASGNLKLDQDAFRDMALLYPELAPLKELRATLSKLRLSGLAVGNDGRNRCMLSPFSSVTGRNQPSNTSFIFGPAKWTSGLIKPGAGTGLAYLDYDQQEFAIAAALSGDGAMQAAYLSGDCYLGFAKQVGAVPEDATKQTHGHIRDQFKQAALGVQYGMGAKSLARKIGSTLSEAKQLLNLHRRTYPKFWAWSDAVLEYAHLYGELHTVLGWRVRVGDGARTSFLRNFPMQSNGAEILRLTSIMTTEAGISVCAPVHDALLIEAPLDQFDATVAKASEFMIRAGAMVLNGFELRVDPKLVRYPDRYMDRRGAAMWNTVISILGRLSAHGEE